jgi:hypothetical protein
MFVKLEARSDAWGGIDRRLFSLPLVSPSVVASPYPTSFPTALPTLGSLTQEHTNIHKIFFKDDKELNSAGVKYGCASGTAPHNTKYAVAPGTQGNCLSMNYCSKHWNGTFHEAQSLGSRKEGSHLGFSSFGRGSADQCGHIVAGCHQGSAYWRGLCHTKELSRPCKLMTWVRSTCNARSSMLREATAPKPKPKPCQVGGCEVVFDWPGISSSQSLDGFYYFINTSYPLSFNEVDAKSHRLTKQRSDTSKSYISNGVPMNQKYGVFRRQDGKELFVDSVTVSDDERASTSYYWRFKPSWSYGFSVSQKQSYMLNRPGVVFKCFGKDMTNLTNFAQTWGDMAGFEPCSATNRSV